MSDAVSVATVADAPIDNDDAISIKTTTSGCFSPPPSDYNPDPEAKLHQLGLHINFPWGWSGSDYDDYDVVTVHGIRDDYKKAWITEDGSWWVKEKLFDTLTTREVDFSYNIDEQSTLYKTNGITLLAEQLLADFAELRSKLDETETDRPIIWICHDLGGAIVKRALILAMDNPSKYGKIAILSSAIFFLGVPHRFESHDDAQDQIHRLLRLPGPDIRKNIAHKAWHLAHQVDQTNQLFLATKIFDRAVIFNIFSHNICNSLRQDPVIDDPARVKELIGESPSDPVTPLSRYTHLVGHSFETAGRMPWQEIDHQALVRGDPEDYWVPAMANMFPKAGAVIRVNYRFLPTQAWLLALSPPTRGLRTPFDPARPINPLVTWVATQTPYEHFENTETGVKFLHLHGDGTQPLDVLEFSRHFYVWLASETNGFVSPDRRPDRSFVYFEFDAQDSRYNDMSSMLIYFITILACRFWDASEDLASGELAFLANVRGWSLDDLYHVFNSIRGCNLSMHNLTFYINGFDQCPEEQRRWFLGRVLAQSKESDRQFRMILASQGRDGLAVENFPEEARINLSECPAVPEQHQTEIARVDSALDTLVKKRPLYKQLEPRIREILHGNDNALYLARIALNWLESQPRGMTKTAAIVESLATLSPLTPTILVQHIISSLLTEHQPRAMAAFNWIKHAAEPWSPESLAEALCIYECGDAEPDFENLNTESIMVSLEAIFLGVIIVDNRNVVFAHPSFYQVPDLGNDETLENSAAKIHSQIAETCLRYFDLPSGQKNLERLSPETLKGGPWTSLLDAIPIAHTRSNMAEYAVRFWPHHYKASGPFKREQLVRDLLANKKSRASWEVPFWLLSNPFIRPRQSYIGALPILARLGLDDMIEAQIEADASQPSFAKDCWFAIVEAAYANNAALVRRLIELAAVDEEMLGNAFSGAVAVGNTNIADALVGLIPSPETFQWPETAFSRVASNGMNDLLAVMMQSGRDINATESYWGSPIVSTASWRRRISTVKFLLAQDPAADLSVVDDEGETALTVAITNGDTLMVELLVAAGADIHVKLAADDRNPAMRAVNFKMHQILKILLKAGVDAYGGKPVKREDNGEGEQEAGDDPTAPIVSSESLLHAAASRGAVECVRAMAESGFDLNAPSDSGTALYLAVVNGRHNLVKVLLELGVKAQWDHAPPEHETALMRAINNEDTQMVSLLLEHGAQPNYVEPISSYIYAKTPLSRACCIGDLETTKLLLEKHADINYIGEPGGDASDPPLFTAIWEDELEVAEHLLEDKTVDVHWAGAVDQLGAIHAAFDKMTVLPKVLEKGAPINAGSIQGTVLHMAARANSHETIEFLVKHDPKPDLESAHGGEYPDDVVRKADVGYTPLQVACANSAAESVKVLLHAGADAKSRNEQGVDALDALLLRGFSSEAFTECLKLLVGWPCFVSVDQVDDQGQTRLHHIRSDTSVSTVQTLIEYGAPFDKQNKQGYTPLAIAISRENVAVAEYLFKRGASLDVYGPGFGSVLHLAVKHAMLPLVKLMVKSGADLERVDPEFESGESLVYTALDLGDRSQIGEMVRYLVDEAKAPVHKLGGRLGYPVILAAWLVSQGRSSYPGSGLLKYLLRRGAQVDAADKYGRRALHFACSGPVSSMAIDVLLKAGASLDVTDNLGRKPIHFAAMSYASTMYLCEREPPVDINVADSDGWTPLLWAARDGAYGVVERLVEKGADLWVRGRGSGTEEWSALRLSRFANQISSIKHLLRPSEHTRVNSDGKKEEWDDDEHQSSVGHLKMDDCTSCLQHIRGIQWKCIECTEDFSLCFKCYRHRSEIHDPVHSFEEIEPLFDEEIYSTSSRSSGSEHGEPGPVEGSEGSVRDVREEAEQISESEGESVFDPDA
ncbi:putative ankyrin repeat protein [Plectosphaerella plurivora]|uniref:Ankyrin repeat protein n=1 Tax=Plectosphaerella plurivora TaxID=936078 RepID=A0A9P8VH33_9PEZI|nr:putative ankyrin repeat protein [Plectosphaerella plurivora]